MARRLEKLRARSASDKELRRAAILAAARRQLRRGVPSAELTVAEVARAAGLAKGSVFRYFPTKEAFVLAVFELELGELFDSLGARMVAAAVATPSGRLDGEMFARGFVAEVSTRPVYLHLATVLHGVLEHNIEVDECVRFKDTLLGYLARGGALLEQLLPFVRPGEGLRLLLRVHALTIGLWQLGDRSPVVSEAIAQAGGRLDAFRIDFAAELEETLVALLRGMEVRK
jgi:AcrR family transcriptional regulator